MSPPDDAQRQPVRRRIRRRGALIPTPFPHGRGPHCATCRCPVDPRAEAAPPTPATADASALASAALLLALGAALVDLLRTPRVADAIRQLRHLHSGARKDPLLVETLKLTTKRGRPPIGDTEALIVLYLRRHLRLVAEDISRALAGHVGDSDGWVAYRCERARTALRASGLTEADLFRAFDWLRAAVSAGALPLPPTGPEGRSAPSGRPDSTE